MMMQAIKEGDDLSYLFLDKLCEKLPNNIQSILVNALNSKARRSRETALGITKSMKIVGMIPELRQLESDDDNQIAQEASEILSNLLRGSSM